MALWMLAAIRRGQQFHRRWAETTLVAVIPVAVVIGRHVRGALVVWLPSAVLVTLLGAIPPLLVMAAERSGRDGR
jgi:hypothetical protein